LLFVATLPFFFLLRNLEKTIPMHYTLIMIKTLAASIREYKKASIITPLCVCVEVLMDVVIPLLMSFIIDYGISESNMGMIWKIGAALVAATLLALIFGVLSGKYAAKASAGFAGNLRKDMYYAIQNFSFSNIDKFSASSLVTRLTTDVTNVQNAYQMIIRIFVRSPLMLIFALIMAFGINARVSLIFLAALPVLGIGLYFIISNAHPTFKKVFRIYDKLNLVVQENLRGIRVVKSYVREEHEIEKFTQVSDEIYTAMSRAQKLIALNSPLMQFAMYGCMLTLSWVSAKMIVAGSMTTGQLMSLFSYTGQILMSLMMFSMILVMIAISRASAERIVQVLQEQPNLTNGSNPVKELTDGSIRFTNLDFSYAGAGGRSCLKNIDLEIASGQTIGIIGSTGSGKTTLVQLIPRLYDSIGGTVFVGGRDVKDYDLETLRDSVAIVLQKNILFSGTIKENLRWVNKDASDEELVQACKLAQADEFIRGFPQGYDTYIEQGGSNVSGGQKQRLCIARGLLKKPKILILDDSTSAVDTKTDALIRQAFRDDIPDTTKIIIAQRISSVEGADKIVVMDGGRVSAIGTHTELLADSAIYREVYESQHKGNAK
jgi:ATP-binding cassette subfamily B protein